MHVHVCARVVGMHVCMHVRVGDVWGIGVELAASYGYLKEDLI